MIGTARGAATTAICRHPTSGNRITQFGGSGQPVDICDRDTGEINIVYVEGLNEDGTVNDDAADKWNDLRVVIGFEGDKPVILGKWRATTEPGAYYTQFTSQPESPWAR